ncbi:MAG: D-2-hydroxyacid dehydrogenase [Bacteroidetes bacterium]|nr:D-2-hydroxyacid dehydrogenase [Bacteroidota bacterium]
MTKILANDGIDEQGKALLEKAGFFVSTEKVKQEELSSFITENQIEVLTVRSATKVRKDIIDSCPNLKIIARGGVGMDNIDVEYAKSKGIEVINTPAASSNSVAELVIAHLFGIVRFLHQSNREMPIKGNTEFETLKKKYSSGTELKGKTIGIIGFGRIGQSVAKIALGLGMDVAAYDPYLEKVEFKLDIKYANPIKINMHTTSLESVLEKSDFLTLHVPGGEVIAKKQLSKMKKGVVLLNASRGGVINEKDLLDALNSGQVAHAALDVFENEPKPMQALLNHPNISLTPHIGAATLEAQERIGVELAEKIIATIKQPK